jgi:sec-independent protein translocase protein TatB
MFGIDSGEILIIAVVALVVIGPKDLPRVMRTIGNFVGRARGMARHFRSGLDTMMREAELEEMEKKWKADNERIMREHPLAPAPAPADAGDSDWGKPAADEPAQARPKAPPAPPSGAPPSGGAPPIPPPAPPSEDLP